MAYAMAKFVALLCVALLVVHVDGARMLKQVGDDTIGMTAKTFATESTVEDFGGQGTPPAVGDAAKFQAAPGTDDSEEYNYNNNDSAKTVFSEELADSGTLLPPIDVSFAQEESVPPGTLYEDVGEPDASSASFAEYKSTEGSEGFSVDDADTFSFSSTNQKIFAADSLGTEASAGSTYSYDATRGDPVYPTESSDGATELSFAGENPQFLYGAGTQSTTDTDDQSFEFGEENKTKEFGP